MILKQEMAPQHVFDHFKWLDQALLEPYRDATYTIADFHLHLLDCWRGLEKGKALGWIRYAPSGYMWGETDIEQYEHYDNPANGHLHVVVPGKFIVFQGPADLGGLHYVDDARRGRTLSPGFYAEALRDMGATAVIRLNEPQEPAAPAPA